MFLKLIHFIFRCWFNCCLYMCWCIVDMVPQWPSGCRRHWKKCARKSTLQYEFIDIGRLVRYCNMLLLPVIFVTHSHCALELQQDNTYSHLISHLSLSHTHRIYTLLSVTLPWINFRNTSSFEISVIMNTHFLLVIKLNVYIFRKLMIWNCYKRMYHQVRRISKLISFCMMYKHRGLFAKQELC